MTPYYEDEWVTIYHGDCREILPSVTAGLVVTDPPYGIAHASNRSSAWMNVAIANDGDTAIRDEVLSHFSEWACFGTHKTSAPAGARGILVWDKGPASGMGDLSFPWKLSWELVFIAGDGWSGRRDEGVLKGMHIVTRASMGRVHPNEKPVDLLQHIIAKHPAPTVFDPFMGSGTTLVAAKSLGRRVIGIEIEECYCEIAAERCSQGVLDLAAPGRC